MQLPNKSVLLPLQNDRTVMMKLTIMLLLFTLRVRGLELHLVLFCLHLQQHLALQTEVNDK